MIHKLCLTNRQGSPIPPNLNLVLTRLKNHPEMAKWQSDSRVEKQLRLNHTYAHVRTEIPIHICCLLILLPPPLRNLVLLLSPTRKHSVYGTIYGSSREILIKFICLFIIHISPDSCVLRFRHQDDDDDDDDYKHLYYGRSGFHFVLRAPIRLKPTGGKSNTCYHICSSSGESAWHRSTYKPGCLLYGGRLGTKLNFHIRR